MTQLKRFYSQTIASILIGCGTALGLGLVMELDTRIHSPNWVGTSEYFEYKGYELRAIILPAGLFATGLSWFVPAVLRVLTKEPTAEEILQKARERFEKYESGTGDPEQVLAQHLADLLDAEETCRRWKL
jgi:hypothetical protein